MYDDVLVPTDGSEGTTETLRHAVDLARNHDATLHTLAVVDERKAKNLPEERQDEALETMHRRAERAVDEVVTRAEEVDIPVRTAVREGAPAERILDYAEDVDVIAIGTHGRSDHERYVRLGSVAQRVVENARVPVFVVHIDGDTG